MDLASTTSLASERGGNRYLLLCIDVFSRYAMYEPLKDKTGAHVAAALQKLIRANTSATHPLQHLWADQGKEYVNAAVKRVLKDAGADLYHTYGPHKSAIAERFIRTLRAAINRRAMATGQSDIVAMLPGIFAEYNSRRHSTTKQAPKDVFFGSEEPAEQVDPWTRVTQQADEASLKVGDLVRISRVKGVFEKGTAANWSLELFRISEAHPAAHGDPEWYRIKDLLGEPVEGMFYRQELQPTDQDPDEALVEKVIRKRGTRSFVKWLGWPEKFSSWVQTSSIE